MVMITGSGKSDMFTSPSWVEIDFEFYFFQLYFFELPITEKIVKFQTRVFFSFFNLILTNSQLNIYQVESFFFQQWLCFRPRIL